MKLTIPCFICRAKTENKRSRICELDISVPDVDHVHSFTMLEELRHPFKMRNMAIVVMCKAPGYN